MPAQLLYPRSFRTCSPGTSHQLSSFTFQNQRPSFTLKIVPSFRLCVLDVSSGRARVRLYKKVSVASGAGASVQRGSNTLVKINERTQAKKEKPNIRCELFDHLWSADVDCAMVRCGVTIGTREGKRMIDRSQRNCKLRIAKLKKLKQRR